MHAFPWQNSVKLKNGAYAGRHPGQGSEDVLLAGDKETMRRFATSGKCPRAILVYSPLLRTEIHLQCKFKSHVHVNHLYCLLYSTEMINLNLNAIDQRPHANSLRDICVSDANRCQQIESSRRNTIPSRSRSVSRGHIICIRTSLQQFINRRPHDYHLCTHSWAWQRPCKCPAKCRCNNKMI